MIAAQNLGGTNAPFDLLSALLVANTVVPFEIGIAHSDRFSQRRFIDSIY